MTTDNTTSYDDIHESREDQLIYPRFRITPNRSFTKGPSLVFLLHHYGQSIGDARYKTEKLLSGESIHATLPLVDIVSDFENEINKIGLEVVLVNADTFYINQD